MRQKDALALTGLNEVSISLIQEAFVGRPKPENLTRHTRQTSLDFENAEFFFIDVAATASPSKICHNGAFAIGIFTEQALLYYLPKILVADILDGHKSGVLMMTLFHGLSGNSGWSKYLKALNLAEIEAIESWLNLVPLEIVSSFKYDGKDPRHCLSDLKLKYLAL